jgi:hypothetical protein
MDGIEIEKINLNTKAIKHQGETRKVFVRKLDMRVECVK